MNNERKINKIYHQVRRINQLVKDHDLLTKTEHIKTRHVIENNFGCIIPEEKLEMIESISANQHFEDSKKNKRLKRFFFWMLVRLLLLLLPVVAVWLGFEIYPFVLLIIDMACSFFI